MRKVSYEVALEYSLHRELASPFAMRAHSTGFPLSSVAFNTALQPPVDHTPLPAAPATPASSPRKPFAPRPHPVQQFLPRGLQCAQNSATDVPPPLPDSRASPARHLPPPRRAPRTRARPTRPAVRASHDELLESSSFEHNTPSPLPSSP
ncbi:hypothetical protein BD626DRAFT_569364 [Schizophyllum amplum]|uniref:Uncharacterized protein n=1 Tax=Schizophyllum amplum TaxID=97359 RepID=A0A550CEW7_9AGAR|nr:hypothetical protein BD626DRAFT_569364 [Auriculariopsis ampla]